MESARERLKKIYDPNLFREASKKLSEVLTTFIADSHAHPEPALPWTPPPELVAVARGYLDRAPLADSPGENFAELANQYLSHINRIHSPHYMGHQVPSPVPIAGLFDTLGAVSNQGSAIYEMGPFSTSAERALIQKLGAKIGWPENTFDAIVTHGGSLANLTGLLAARNIRYPDAWARGDFGGKVPAIITSRDSHYSIARAAGVLGLGTQNVLKAELTDRRTTDSKKLVQLIERSHREGREVFALVASACSTPTGAFDDLEELADVARRYGIWLHIDGAHGASLLLSPKYRDRVKGIDAADSLVWDAHKMMFVPALMTFLFYKDRANSYRPFEQEAPYLFDPAAPDIARYDGALRTLECTKRAMALGVWGVWSTYGERLFADLIEVTIDLTRDFYEMLKQTSDFEPLHEPQANILCFRHIPDRLQGAPPETISLFQQKLRRVLIESGRFYITSTRLDDGMALRVTLINPVTEKIHLEGLLEACRDLGRGL